MGAVFSLIIVLFVAFFLIRAGTAALTLLGLSRDLALFQAISAFTGVGYTTAESELILTHPDRRKVVMALMVVGNIGLMTAVSSLVLTFASADLSDGIWRVAWLIAGLSIVTFVLLQRRVAVVMHRLFRDLLRRTGRLDVQDFVDLLQLTGEYGVIELNIGASHWLAGRRLAETRLLEEGVTVLGIQRPDGSFTGVPRGETRLEVDDVLVVYGKESAIETLCARRQDSEGQVEHEQAVQGTRHERAIQAREERRRQQELEQELADAPKPEDGPSGDEAAPAEPVGASTEGAGDVGESGAIDGRVP